MKTKDQALTQVIENNPDEYLKVYGFAKAWIKTRMKEFTAEDLKIDYERLNQPLRQPNVYGAVFSSLNKNGLLRYCRHQKSRLPAARSRQIAVWVSIFFRLKQQANARKETSLTLF